MLFLWIKHVILDDYYFKIHVFRLTTVLWQNLELLPNSLKAHSLSALAFTPFTIMLFLSVLI